MTYDPQSPDPYASTRPMSPPGPYVPPQQYPASPSPYGYQPPMVLQVARPSSSLSVWALVLGIFGVAAGWCMLGIPCLIAVFVGHAAVKDTKDDVKSGRGMAVTGLALGYVGVAPAIILFFWLFLGTGMALLPSGTPTTPVANASVRAHWYRPKPADFVLTPQIVKKDCPDSHGCAITFKAKVRYAGKSLDPRQTFWVTYTLDGGGYGPENHGFFMTGSTVSDEQGATMTNSPKAKLTLKATAVSPE